MYEARSPLSASSITMQRWSPAKITSCDPALFTLPNQDCPDANVQASHSPWTSCKDGGSSGDTQVACLQLNDVRVAPAQPLVRQLPLHRFHFEARLHGNVFYGYAPAGGMLNCQADGA